MEIGTVQCQRKPQLEESGDDLPDKSVGIQCSLFQTIPIQDVASERWNLLAIHDLCRTGAWFGVLTGHSGDSDNGFVGAPDENQTHLKKKFDLGLNGILLAIVKKLCAVASLEEESPAKSDVSQARLQLHNLCGGDNGRKSFEFQKRFLDGLTIRVNCVLLDWFRSPRAGSPSLRVIVTLSQSCCRRAVCLEFRFSSCVASAI